MNAPRMSTRAKAYAAVAMALLLWAPQGISTESNPLVTGHSTFFNGKTYDQCLASIAGILRTRVMWFNHVPLVENYGGRGTFIYVTEHGAPDPTEMDFLYTDGVFYDFVDPNGARWHIEEAYTGPIKPASAHVNDLENARVEVGVVDPEDRDYVWIVELADRPIYDEFAPRDINDPNYHTIYNFLVLVDTCKFRNETAEWRTVSHTGLESGHDAGEENHTHDGYTADIWIGRRPNLVSGGATPDGVAWQAHWATSAEGQQHMQQAPNQTKNQTL